MKDSNKYNLTCQEKKPFKNDGFLGGLSDGENARFSSLSHAQSPYLTNTDKSDSNSPSTPVFSTDFSSQKSTDFEDYYKEKSMSLFNETKKLLNHDKKALRQIHQMGFQRIRAINNDTLVIYTNFNRIGNRDAGWKIAENDSNTDKARLASKQLAYERALANNDVWAYFATFTFDQTKQDRNDFQKLLSRLTTFLRRRGIRYFLVPELHKNGGIHFHALLSKEIEPHLSDFKDTAPKALKNKYIAAKLAKGEIVKNCASISETFGYTIIEPIRNVDSCVQYLTKYVLKTFDSENFQRISRRRFFCSKGLKCPKIVLPHQIDLENFDLVALSSHTQKIYLKRSTDTLRAKGLSLGSLSGSRSRYGVSPFPIKQPEFSSG